MRTTDSGKKSESKIDWEMYLGFAVGELHLPPREFWQMTFVEFMTAYAYLLPEEDSKKEFVPFTEEEKAILAEMERKYG